MKLTIKGTDFGKARTKLTEFTTRKSVNILLVNNDESVHEEFIEFFGEISAKDFFANSTEEAIRVLNEHTIDVVILKISRLSDAAILKYINDYYKHIKVLVSARKDFDEALTIFNQTQFEKLNNPIGLADLRGHLTLERN